MDAAKNHLAPGLAIRSSQGARDYQEDDCDFLILGDGGDGDGDGDGDGAGHGHGDGDGNTGAPGMLLVLADGMGGHVGGAVASKTAVDNFIAAWQRDNGTGDGGDGDGDGDGDDACDGDGDGDGDGACDGDGDGDGDDIPARLTAALAVANNSLRARVAADASLTGMGCTLVGAVITAGKLHWISIGDSPLWLLQGGELQRLNQDHSMAPLLQNLVDAGRMTAAEAAADPRRHALRAALMGDELNLVDCAGVALPSHEPARVLLASDGVQTLSDGEIAAIMRDTPAADPCAARLLQAVEDKQHPRQDNTTVMVYDPPAILSSCRKAEK